MNKNQQQDIDISDFIHTVELIINHFFLLDTTYEFYKNHDNISFDIVRAEDFTHLKIHIEDIKKLNIRSFGDLSTYVYNFINKIYNEIDRYKLLSAYNNNRIKIFRLDVYNRIYYNQNKDLLNLFNQIRKRYILFDILLPHLKECNNTNDNSLYLNMKNNKEFILYDEKEKRDLSSIKFEMRFHHRDNLERILKLDKSTTRKLSIRNVASLSLPELMKSYNKYIDSFNNSMILKKYRKSLEITKAEIIDIASKFSTNVRGEEDITIDNLLNIYQNILMSRNDIKNSLKYQRKNQKGAALRNYHSMDNKIKETVRKKHIELYHKLYPEEFEELIDDNFFLEQIPSYSYVLSYFDFDNTTKYRWITSGLIADLRKLRKEHRAFHNLTLDEENILKRLTLDKITPVIKKIEAKYRFNKPKLKKDKKMADSFLSFFEAPDTIPDDELKDKFKELVKVYLSHSPEYVRLIKDLQYFFNKFKFNNCLD